MKVYLKFIRGLTFQNMSDRNLYYIYWNIWQNFYLLIIKILRKKRKVERKQFSEKNVRIQNFLVVLIRFHKMEKFTENYWLTDWMTFIRMNMIIALPTRLYPQMLPPLPPCCNPASRSHCAYVSPPPRLLIVARVIFFFQPQSSGE